MTPAVWLAVAAVVVYAVMWVAHSLAWGWLHTADWFLLNPAHDIGVKNPAWVRFWDGVSFVLGPVPLRLLGSLAAAVMEALDRQVAVRHEPARPGEIQHSVGSTAGAERLLGLTARVELIEGLRLMLGTPPR